MEVLSVETPAILDATDDKEFIIGWNLKYLEVKHNEEVILGHWMEETFEIYFIGIKSR